MGETHLRRDTASPSRLRAEALQAISAKAALAATAGAQARWGEEPLAGKSGAIPGADRLDARHHTGEQGTGHLADLLGGDGGDGFQ